MAGFGVLLQEDLENLLKDWTCGGVAVTQLSLDQTGH